MAKMAVMENLFFPSSPEPKGQLTPNLLGSIGVTCITSKIAKIMLIINLFFASSPNPMPIDSKLGRKHRGDL